MNQILKISKLNLNYSYLLLQKNQLIDANFFDIKETYIKRFEKN